MSVVCRNQGSLCTRSAWLYSPVAVLRLFGVTFTTSVFYVVVAGKWVVTRHATLIENEGSPGRRPGTLPFGPVPLEVVRTCPNDQPTFARVVRLGLLGRVL